MLSMPELMLILDELMLILDELMLILDELIEENGNKLEKSDIFYLKIF